jgi:hypothetical protein
VRLSHFDFFMFTFRLIVHHIITKN